MIQSRLYQMVFLNNIAFKNNSVQEQKENHKCMNIKHLHSDIKNFDHKTINKIHNKIPVDKEIIKNQNNFIHIYSTSMTFKEIKEKFNKKDDHLLNSIKKCYTTLIKNEQKSN